jgi:phosphotransferase system enzyme I (PtsI)
MMILNDPGLTMEIEGQINGNMNAEMATENVCNMFADMFAAMDNEMFQQRATDVKDIKVRLNL